MIAGAARLLAQRGLQATSFSTVLAETNAPRGAIYHHLPAARRSLLPRPSRRLSSTPRLIDRRTGAPARGKSRQSFLAAWRALLTYTDFETGLRAGRGRPWRARVTRCDSGRRGVPGLAGQAGPCAAGGRTERGRRASRRLRCCWRRARARSSSAGPSRTSGRSSWSRRNWSTRPALAAGPHTKTGAGAETDADA